MKKIISHTKVNSMVGMAPIVLFLSSYIPLFLLIAVRQVLSNSEFLIWGGLHFGTFINFMSHFGMATACLFLTCYGFVGTYITFKNIDEKVENGNIVKIIEISSMNDEPLAYVATYIVPIMFNDYSNLADNITVLCIFYVVYKLYVRSNNTLLIIT